MKKRTLALLILTILVLFVILLPKLIPKDTMSYEEAVSKWAQGKLVMVDGKKVHYLEKGEGPPIILIHGFLYNTVMVIFEKAGHTPQEEYPEKFNPLAVEFLSK
jgi:hypothetical protein